MKKNYLSPSLKVVIIESATMLLAGSDKEDEKNPVIGNVTIDGNDQQITDGGETDPDTEYEPM